MWVFTSSSFPWHFTRFTNPIFWDRVICNTFHMILRTNVRTKDWSLIRYSAYPLSLAAYSFTFNHTSHWRIKHASTEATIQLWIPLNSPSLDRQLVKFIFSFCKFCCYKSSCGISVELQLYWCSYKSWHRAFCPFFCVLVNKCISFLIKNPNWCSISVLWVHFLCSRWIKKHNIS